MGFILVPRCQSAVVSWFQNSMLKIRDRLFPKQLFCNSQGIGSKLSVTKVRGKIRGVENLWQRKRFSFLVVT
ncbi:MAG: hypothetical protein WCD63_15340, partial [Terrimicrobiaceae bacterium]